ncbi:MAG: hypothetical protein OEN55_14680 [Alphaproteobacteria bacterium]|nr:hypothetical protein [Alphaproteobacteria bacterium]
MEKRPASGITPVAEANATGAVADEYADIRRVLELPFVPDLFKTAAHAPEVLVGTWALERNLFIESTLPLPLAAMILYAISAAKGCEYSSSAHYLTCRSLGVEDSVLRSLRDDLSALAPARIHAIVSFASKAALDPQSLGEADYDTVRRHGVGDRELVEIVGLAALGNYMDTLADGLKVEVDEIVSQALAG